MVTRRTGQACLRMIALSVVGGLLLAGGGRPVAAAPDAAKIGHIVVIIQENRSFDSLYGSFPGANGRANAGAAATQVDRDGNPYAALPQPLDNSGKPLPYQPDPRFPAEMPNGPYLMSDFVKQNELHGDTWHRFYQEQLQINGGKMDKFAAWSDNPGLTMGYWETEQLPLTDYARRFTLLDNFFHSAFGGSFLAHMWLICACTPTFPNSPPEMRAQLDEQGVLVKDGELSPDGDVINTAYTSFTPHPATVPPERLLPPQTMPTIGDRLTEKGVSWAWYAGGWNDAIAGQPSPLFKFHHHPFAYFERYGDGTEQRALHLRDEQEFVKAVADGSLPAVSFVKPIGADNEHPGYADLQRGQLHVVDLLRAIEASPIWNDTVVIVTYDENGGLWDHVAPPKIDRWGPGTRVPTLIVSPLARKGVVDHTQSEHASILALIETRFGLAPLAERDAKADNLLGVLDLPEAAARTP